MSIMITDSQKIDLISKCFGKYLISGSGKNISVICPYCISKGKITRKKKLSISLETGIFHCWVCENKGRNIGRTALKFCKRDLSDAKNLFMCFKGSSEESIEDEIKNHVRLPKDFTLISNLSGKRRSSFNSHLTYLKSRGFSNIDIHRFRVGVSDEYEFKNYVIFPSNTDSGSLNYYISRTIDPKNKRRYRNCNVSRKDVIFREFDIDFSKELVLVEGVFDLVNCPENATCILGSWMDENYELFRKIVKFRTPVVLCLDPDARKKSMEIAKKLLEYCVPVRISCHSDKDFGDMSREEVENCINTSK